MESLNASNILLDEHKVITDPIMSSEPTALGLPAPATPAPLVIVGEPVQTDRRLLEAAGAGATDLVLHLIEENGPRLHTHKDQDGKSALHLASAAGHLETVTALTLNGAEVNAQDFTGYTSLQKAASEGHLEVVKHLLSRGAAMDHQDEVHGNTALHEAAWRGFSRTVEHLCKAKSNYYLRNRGGFSPLHLCCQNGHNETCRVLLRAGCKPNIKNNYGDTPLHTASRYGHAGAARILLSADCNPNLQNKNGDTPLHIAAAMGRRKLVRILLEAGPDIEVRNLQRESAADLAGRKGHKELQETILDPPAEIVQLAQDRRKRDPSKALNSSKDSSQTDGNVKQRTKKKHKGDPKWSPYGCHYYPDPTDFPEPNPASLPEEPLGNGEQYYLDLAGNIKKGPASGSNSCHCAPFLDRFERKMDRNKRQVFQHLDRTHGKLANRISHLEKRTRDQLCSLSNQMKESLAQERVECLDRMERRAIRDRIAIERHSGLREVMLRGDLSAWIEARVSELERDSHHRQSEDAAFLRTLLRGSRRRGAGHRAFWARLQATGTLRRAASEDDLNNMDGGNNNEVLVRDATRRQSSELRVSDHPQTAMPLLEEPQQQPRLRRNSAGDEDAAAALFCDFGDFHAAEIAAPEPRAEEGGHEGQPLYENHALLAYSTHSDRGSATSSAASASAPRPRPPQLKKPQLKPALGPVYQNFEPRWAGPAARAPPPLLPLQPPPPPYRPAPAPAPGPLAGPLAGLLPPHPALLGATQTTSDGGDSHNDSGYCTRPGGSCGGPSPSLSGSQGRPDSPGQGQVQGQGQGQGQAAAAAGIAPKIKMLQQKLSLARFEDAPRREEAPRGSLV